MDIKKVMLFLVIEVWTRYRTKGTIDVPSQLSLPAMSLMY